jgi:hypothetical protein
LREGSFITMTTELLRCALCDQAVGDNAQRVAIRPEDWAWLKDEIRRRAGERATAMMDRVKELAVHCPRCAALPKEERRRLVPEMWARQRRRIARAQWEQSG